jgi:hypothetical protein
MKEQLDAEMVFKIAPEKWIMTRWSAYVIGGVVVLNFLLFIICRPKCWQRPGCDCSRFFIFRWIESLIYLANIASDGYYLATVPTMNQWIRYTLVVTILIPQFLFLRFSLRHAYSKTVSVCSFTLHFWNRYISYLTGQINHFIIRETELKIQSKEPPKIDVPLDLIDKDPFIAKYMNNTIYLLIQDIP